MKSIFAIRAFFILFSACVFLFFSSCSQKKNTLTSRTYHSLTAHYNGLYWANVSLEEGIDNLARAHKDDYSKTLPLFKYADDAAAKANYPQFDKAIEKTNKVIQYHSMMIDGKEHNRWIDENYMTLGRAHFYKRDYYAAVVVFEYVIKVFPDNPARYDAFLWLVRCYNQMNSVIKTGPILDLLKHDNKLPRRLLDDYQSVLADYYLRTEQTKKAQDALIKAIVLTGKKTTRGRYYYVLAQLFEQENYLKKATEYYAKSARLHPSYEMEFNARLAKARTFQVDRGTGTKDLISELNKMLKDEKNKEYKDQIYYALGDISYRENKITEAINLFKQSAASSVANTKQKGMSYLRVADIYFDKREYKAAQAYYDSTIIFLPQDFKNYDQVKNKKETLSALIKNMNIIVEQDSLLKLASMDTTQVNKMIDDIIAKVIKEEEQKKKEEEQNSTMITNTAPSDENSPALASTVGSWYFYNSSTISFGFSEFFKKWGGRTLEDNWRRSNKEVILAEQNTNISVKDTTAKGKIADNKTRPYYLKNIPFTGEQKNKAHTSITDAYYTLGGIYKEDLQDNPRAAVTFEELLKLYPTSKYTLNLYYQLYRIFLTEKNTEKANYYKSKILTEYPDSEYAKIIKNPDYQKALNASQNEIEKYYNETYSAYHQSKYDNVIAMVNKADSFYSASTLMPKFALLRAYSIGKTKKIEDYEHSLQGIIAKYPKDDVKVKAQELLDYLKKSQKGPADAKAEKMDTVKQVYTFNDTAKYLCMIVYNSTTVSIEDMKVKISNFNSEYFRNSDLSINNTIMDTTNIVYVTFFESAAKAKDYHDLLNQDSKVFSDIPPGQYTILPISKENFPILFKEKNLDGYKKFYQRFYKASDE